MAYTCDPVMVLCDDINFIDGIVQEQYKDIDIHTKEFRKNLIAERKKVIHQIIIEWDSLRKK